MKSVLVCFTAGDGATAYVNGLPIGTMKDGVFACHQYQTGNFAKIDAATLAQAIHVLEAAASRAAEPTHYVERYPRGWHPDDEKPG